MWYDLFSLFYDRALEDLYAPHRPPAVNALRLPQGGTVVDVPCGTGQSLNLLTQAVGSSGHVLGIDRSRGMLRRAARRIGEAGWDNIILRRMDASELDATSLDEATGRSDLDAVLCALGLTAFSDWETVFDQLFALVRPGGRIVLFDVYARERNREAKTVELIARADLSREVWRPLQARCSDFERRILSTDAQTFGGELYLAEGTRP